MRSKRNSVLLNIISIGLVVIWCCALAAADSAAPSPFGTLKYPVARRDDSIIDTYNGTNKVPDPYQWMENPESNETKKWIADLNALSEPLLCGNCNWKKVNEEMTKMVCYDRFQPTIHRGKYYFTSAAIFGKNTSVYKQNTAEEELQNVLFNKDTMPPGQNIVKESFSPDGNWYAYGVSNSGSDWLEFHVRNTESCKDGPDCVKEIKMSNIEWSKNGKGFFYCRYPGANTTGTSTTVVENQKVYYHVIGEASQNNDVLVAELTDNPKYRLGITVSNDGKYFILIVLDPASGTSGNAIYYADFDDSKPITGKFTLKPLIAGFQFIYGYVTNNGPKMVFQTNSKAANGRLIVVDITNPAEDKWTDLIAEDPKIALDSAICINKDKIVCQYTENVKNILRVHSADSGQKICDIPLESATIPEYSGSYQYPEFFFKAVTFVNPAVIYKVDFTNNDCKPVLLRATKSNFEGYDPNNYKVDQVFYKSKDGTQIPMYIVKNKNATGIMPCLMYAYGGFSISNLPAYVPPFIYFMDKFGGILAFPGIRGGNEYGEKWHAAGCKENKPNVFEDFKAAADHLVQQKLTEYKKIVIHGGSNGGLLVATCINQAPNKFGAAWVDVGILDMLRFPLFTVGADYVREYGNPNKTEFFTVLKAYSPLHNLKKPDSAETEYPYLLVTTADHDDRVPPLHTLKYLAEMFNAIKDNPNQKNAIFGMVYANGGHGGGGMTSMLRRYTDFQIFAMSALRLNATK